MIVINTQKDFLGPTVIKVSGKDLTGANLQTGIFMNYHKLTIIRQRQNEYC